MVVDVAADVTQYRIELGELITSLGNIPTTDKKRVISDFRKTFQPVHIKGTEPPHTTNSTGISLEAFLAGINKDILGTELFLKGLLDNFAMRTHELANICDISARQVQRLLKPLKQSTHSFRKNGQIYYSTDMVALQRRKKQIENGTDHTGEILKPTATSRGDMVIHERNALQQFNSSAFPPTEQAMRHGGHQHDILNSNPQSPAQIQPNPNPNTPSFFNSRQLTSPNTLLKSPDNPPFSNSCGACEQADLGACQKCPLSYATFEYDVITHIILDKEFRDYLLKHATDSGWDVRETRNSNVLRYQNYTFVLYEDLVQLSIDDGEVNDLSSMLLKECSDYPQIRNIPTKITRPAEITNTELTIPIFDKQVGDNIAKILRLDETPGQHQYHHALNSITPSFKIYRPSYDTKIVRIEFVSGSATQAISALTMRQELLRMIPDLGERPGMFDDWMYRHYLPSGIVQSIDVTVEGTPKQDLKAILDSTAEQFNSATEALSAIASSIQQQPQPQIEPENHQQSPKPDITTWLANNPNTSKTPERIINLISTLLNTNNTRTKSGADPLTKHDMGQLLRLHHPGVKQSDTRQAIKLYKIWKTEQKGSMIGYE